VVQIIGSDLRTGLVYLRKWTLVSVIVGLLAGLAALVLLAAIGFFTDVFLGTMVGHVPPVAGGEFQIVINIVIERPWLIPVSTTIGGLLSGVLVELLAPEARGIGTDSAIGAFHREHSLIRTRVPLVKLLASAITIGSGCTSGREGPIAQMGGGLGAQIARFLGLTERERGIALAAGLGAGIAAVFKAPLAGGILSGELFYRHDFEAEALIPGFIASTVSYSVVGFVTGWSPVFRPSVNPVAYTHPQILPLYALLGLVCAVFVRFLFKVFFGVQHVFADLTIPNFLKPAVGGFLTGMVGMFIPSALGVGYGWLQIAIDQNYIVFPVTMMFLAIFAEIFAMSFTLGSGASGGIFGPCVMTGGLIGATFGYFSQQLFPETVANPSDFTIVGMIAFFGGAAKAPLAVIVMIVEMTGGYSLLAPAMLTVVVAYLLSGRMSIFVNQVDSLEDSPAHAKEYETLILERVKVSEVMTKIVRTVSPAASLKTAQDLMEMDEVGGLPVVIGGRLVGIITRSDILRLEPSKRAERTVDSAMSKEVLVASPEEDLFSVLTKMISKGVGRLPVVSHEKPEMLLGIITRADFAKALVLSREK
jgi:CIC family chloride channel protein